MGETHTVGQRVYPVAQLIMSLKNEVVDTEEVPIEDHEVAENYRLEEGNTFYHADYRAVFTVLAVTANEWEEPRVTVSWDDDGGMHRASVDNHEVGDVHPRNECVHPVE